MSYNSTNETTAAAMIASSNSTLLPGTTTPSFQVYQYGRGLPFFRHSLTMTALLSTVYIIVFVLAIFNNILVVSVIVRNPNMRNVTNYFLANLAVADIMVSFLVLPITLLSNLLSGKRTFFYWINLLPSQARHDNITTFKCS